MRVLVAGCGRVGAGLARTLAHEGHQVCVLDADPRQLRRLGSSFPGEQVAHSPMERPVLVAAGIERADAVAAVFDSEPTNVSLSLAARRLFRVPRVVSLVHNPRLAEFVHRLGVLPLSPLSWGVRRLADLVCRTAQVTVTSLGAQVDLVEVTVPPTLDGRAVEDLAVAGELQVVSVTRAGRTTLAEPGLRLQEGDHLHLVVRGAGQARLRSLLTA